MSKRKQDDLEDLSANPEKKRKRSGEPSAKTSAERSRKYRASLSEEQKRKKKVEAAKKTKTAYNAMTPQQRIERSQRQAELYKTMRKEEKDAYIAANAQRMTTTYHAMPEEEKDAYIAANAQRMTATYHAMDPEQKNQLNVDKARRSREMYHAMDADDKAATIAASSDNRKRRKLCDEKNVLLNVKEALRKRMARSSSLDEPRNAETDLDESIEQFWELRSSGQLDPSVHPVGSNELVQAIQREAVTEDIKEECMKAYKEAMSPMIKPLHCASCGERGYDDDVGCRAIRLDALAMLKMDDEIEKIFVTLSEEERNTWTVVKHGDKYYHLHASALVTEDEDPHVPRYNICRDCMGDMNDKHQLPRYALKNGCDYGRRVQFDFSALSDLEKVAISQGRLFSHIYLIRHIKSGETVSHSLQGHVISFPQDAPSRLSVLPDMKCVSEAVRVVFVGPQSELERIRADPNLKSSYVKLRGRQISAALKYLRLVNPLYQNVAIRSDTDIFDDCSRGKILANIDIDESDKTSSIAQAVSGSDVAEVRLNADPESVEASKTRRYDESLVCLLMTTAAADLSKKSLVVLNDTLVKEKPEPVREQAQTFHLPRAEEPYNEFVDNGKMLMESFPHLFVRGQGATYVKGGLSARQILHYLRQFDNRFATDTKFLFTLFNQRQRHSVARAISARARRGSDGTFNELLAMVNEENFAAHLEKALVDPTSAETREFTRKITAAIKVGGSGIPFSPAEQSLSLAQLYSMILFFGPPTWFVTISPDDVHSAIVIRMSQTEKDFKRWISTTSGNEDYLSFVLRHPQLYNLYKQAAENPVASSYNYNRMLNAVLTHLFQLPPEKVTKKSVSPEERGPGILGHVKAYYHISEGQERKTLHTHGVVWCYITPKLLQAIAHDQRTQSVMATTLETMVKAELPKHVFDSSVFNKRDAAITELPSLRPILQEMPTSGMEIDQRAYEVAAKTNIHRFHTFTCTKGKSGKFGCRLLYKQACCRATCCVQLQAVTVIDDNGKQRIVPQPLQTIEPPPHKTSNLFVTDDRCLVWEIKRPEMPSYDDDMQTASPQMSLTPKDANGNVVCFSPTLTAAVCSNSAVYLLGALEQAKAICFYLIKYMLKNTVELTNCLVAAQTAAEKIAKRPSRAADVGTETRTTMHFWEVLLNNMHGGIEVASTQVAANLLGLKNQVSSHGFWLLYADSACRYVQASADAITINETSLDDADDTDGISARADTQYPMDDGNDDDDEGDCDDTSMTSLARNMELNATIGGYQVDPSNDSFFIRDDNDDINEWSRLSHGAGHPHTIVEEPWPPNTPVPTAEESTTNIIADVAADLPNVQVPEAFGDEILEYHDRYEGDEDYIALNTTEATGQLFFDPTSQRYQCVTQHENYRNRGALLESLCLYEYTAMIVIVKRKNVRESVPNPLLDSRIDKEDLPDGDDDIYGAENDGDTFDNVGKTRGRKCNATFPFSEGYVLHETHVQRLRSKFLIPQLVGRVPRYPRRLSEDPVHVRIAYRYALYALTLFKPWDLVTGVPAPSPSWETYCQYVVDLASASASLRQRSILQLLENLAEGLHGNVVNATRKMLVSKYRARAVKPWKDLPASEKPIDPTALYRDTEKVIPEQDMDQARIDAMRAVLTKTTAITSTTRRDNTNDYLSKSKHELTRIYEAAWEKLKCGSVVDRAIHADVREKQETAGVPLSALRITSIDSSHGKAKNTGHQQVIRIIADLRHQHFTISQMNEVLGYTTEGNLHLLDQLALPRLREPAVAVTEGRKHSVHPLSVDNAVDTSIPSPALAAAISLSDEQQKIVRLVSKQFQEYLDSYQSLLASTGNTTAAAKEAAPREQLLLTILGPPDAGKSVVVNAIADIADAYATCAGLEYSILLNAATTGAAAANLRPGARTVHNTFGIQVNPNVESHEANVKLKPLEKEVLQRLQTQFKLVSTIVICECSMLTAIMLYHVSMRCQEITGNTKPFGGMDVLLVGDFSQLPPTSGHGLYKEVLVYNDGPVNQKTFNSRYAANSPRLEGTLLFQTFTTRQLKTIQRSKDDELHNRHLTKIRDDGIVDADLVTSLKILSAEDFPAFENAPIVVTSNAEINALTEPVLQQFARSHHQPVIKWRKPLSSKTSQIVGSVTNVPKVLDNLYSLLPESGYQYFVCGSDAVAYLTENISPSVGLGNGVPITLHSLVFATQEDEVNVRQRVLNAQPGEVIDISDCIPKYVNVETARLALLPDVRREIVQYMAEANLPSPSLQQAVSSRATISVQEIWAAQTQQSVIFPLPLGSKIDRYPVQSGGGKIAHFSFRRFPYDIGLLSTLHKIQGKTIPRLILQLNQRRGTLLSLGLFGLLVALSRVTSRENIRIMPPHEEESKDTFLDYLKDLQPCMFLRRWVRGINEDGSWTYIPPSSLDQKTSKKTTKSRAKSKPASEPRGVTSTRRPPLPASARICSDQKVATPFQQLPSSSTPAPPPPWQDSTCDKVVVAQFLQELQSTKFVFYNMFNIDTLPNTFSYDDANDVITNGDWLSAPSIDAFVHGTFCLHQCLNLSLLRCFPVAAMRDLLSSMSNDTSAKAIEDFHGVFNDWPDNLLLNGDILFPVHHDNHFFLVVLECISPPSSPHRIMNVFFVDSKADTDDKECVNNRYDLVLTTIKAWYEYALQHSRTTSSLTLVWNTIPVRVPQQRDDCSCGIFLCAFVFSLIRTYPLRPVQPMGDRISSLNSLVMDDLPTIRKWILWIVATSVARRTPSKETQGPSIIQRFSVEDEQTSSQMHPNPNGTPTECLTLFSPADQAVTTVPPSISSPPTNDRIFFVPRLEDEDEVRLLWSRTVSNDTVVVTPDERSGGNVVTHHTFKRLMPNQWLNDEIINFYFVGLLKTRDSVLVQSGKRPSLFLNSYFMSKLFEEGIYQFANVQRWTRNVRIEAIDKVFVPIHANNNHFALIVVYVETKQVHYVDSMLDATRAQHFCSLIFRWLADVLEEAFVESEWTKVQHNSPQQCNSSDCGVFTATNAAFLANDLPLDYPGDIASMEQQRLRIAICLLKKRLPF